MDPDLSTRRDGKIVETWAQMEVAKLLQQLGAVPGAEGM
jgi:hypothetical protein